MKMLKKKILVAIIVGYLILAGTTSVIIAEKGAAKKDTSIGSDALPKNKLQVSSFDATSNFCIYDRNYWAILIGIGNYPGTSGDLPYSVNEILSFQNTLLDGGNWNDSHIHVITDTGATKAGIFDAISWLVSNTDENDISIFYFAGHGGRTSSNEYLRAYDESISDIELDEKLDDVKGQLVVILDSCYSGGFIEEVGERGRVVLTACKKNESTYQVHNLKSGIFGYFINLSLERFTKSAETTFLFTWFFSVYYSNKLSQEFDGDYTIHPQMYDGNLMRTRLINRHSYAKTFLNKIFTISLEHNDLKIWRM
jgi:hypothetical protein